MLKAALVALSLMAAAPAPAAPFSPMRPSAANIALDQTMVITDMTWEFPDVDVEVRWIPCMTENAWYSLASHRITLCLELNETPAPVFVAAHETAHAITIQLGLDMGQGPTAVEDAADEVAALMLIDMGREDEVVNGALWFIRMALENVDATHSSHTERAYRLLCLVDGATREGSLACQLMYRDAKANWDHQLAPHRG